jgi:tRNA pseudouridine55 synthase
MNAEKFQGLLMIDKPGGMTSRAVVDRVCQWFPRGTRIGHAGTLDPLATGVLVVCVGVATRLVEYVQAMEKEYQAGLLLDRRSDTDDADGKVEIVDFAHPPPERAAILQCLQGFVGEIEQVPPAYSAARVSGQRAYTAARRGKELTLESRVVHIDSLEVRGYEYPRLEICVRCGKGTYIRALARDFGLCLGRSAIVETLRRTRIGPFMVEGAIPLTATADQARATLLPLKEAVAGLPCLSLESEQLQRLRQGQTITVHSSQLVSADAPVAFDVAVFDGAGELSVVAVADSERRLLTPIKVLRASVEA